MKLSRQSSKGSRKPSWKEPSTKKIPTREKDAKSTKPDDGKLKGKPTEEGITRTQKLKRRPLRTRDTEGAGNRTEEQEVGALKDAEKKAEKKIEKKVSDKAMEQEKVGQGPETGEKVVGEEKTPERVGQEEAVKAAPERDEKKKLAKPAEKSTKKNCWRKRS
ncbi:hypothetical protein JTB14_018999 [Gonioctena quinquepunctata]|nr:hypothetical protein JTB14_018999 [Gonioctena quinquepunctata]